MFLKIKIVLALIAILYIPSLCAQDTLLTKPTNDHRRFALSFGIGRTQGYDQFEFVGRSHPDVLYIDPRAYNFALGFTWYHKKRWFTSLHWHQFTSTTGARVTIDLPPEEGIDFERRGKSIGRASIFNNYSVRVGRTHFFQNPRWQTRWLAGMNFKHVSHDVVYNPLNVSDDPFFSLSQNLTPETQTGIAPSVQAGYQVAYRGKKMGLSLIVLGNLGLKYYLLDEYTARINFEEYNATINTKDDLIAWTLQYEVYFGNTTNRRDKK